MNGTGDLKMQTSSSDSETLIGCKSYALIASSTPSERLFSQAGLLSSQPSVQPNHAQKLLRVLAKINLKKDWNSFFLDFLNSLIWSLAVLEISKWILWIH
jgi:hypothetical protein